MLIDVRNIKTKWPLIFSDSKNEQFCMKECSTYSQSIRRRHLLSSDKFVNLSALCMVRINKILTILDVDEGLIKAVFDF